ncbi:EAL domain-containing protein (putative c-di-GMP-specific phosphodiesterase class I) [Sphingomonas sp. PP-CE-3A-406]|nr:EAL domain-containing protein (putative c-di-GMP-specific phosphodiesterase class I) [Sphingomonas sp. PP-CE-3A-406]
MSEHPYSQIECSPTQTDARLVDPVLLGELRQDGICDRALNGWRFLILAEIANFAALRRHLGKARSETLIVDFGARVREALPDARIVAVGREILEIAFESGARLALDVAIAALEGAFERPFDIDGETHDIQARLGGAAAAPHRDEVHLIEAAEQALAEARIERTPVALDVAGSTEAIDRAQLVRDLPVAIENEELFLQYQPKVHLRRQQITSVEALVRWNHPTRGMVLPSDFIPLAEETHDIVALTLWTIRRSIEDQKILSRAGHDLRVFINISGVLLADAWFVRQACALVEQSGAQLGFEITETSVIRDPESAIANLKVFAEIGIVIAIDDYGAGLSSLAYLKQLPARELKIDKLFVTQLTSSNRDPLIVRSTIDLAHALEMEVVAEGVETPAAMALLSVMGCDMIQGFLISRPINIDALIHFLDDGKALALATDVRAPFNRLATVWKRA